MRFGMCNLSMVPVRFEPSHKSEMVTQLLFGELFEIIEKTENWSKVKLIYDQYEGWVDVKQYLPLYNETFEKLHDFGSTISIDIVHVLINETKNYVIPIVLGSSLPFVVNQTFYIVYRNDLHVRICFRRFELYLFSVKICRLFRAFSDVAKSCHIWKHKILCKTFFGGSIFH